MNAARRFVVKGRVQGVGYRYFAIRAAAQCGVVGTVRNQPDGSVEAIAEGSEDAVTEFGRELARGPSYGHVTSIEETNLAPTGRYRGFDVVY
jgi:acylphosphatase